VARSWKRLRERLLVSRHQLRRILVGQTPRGGLPTSLSPAMMVGMDECTFDSALRPSMSAIIAKQRSVRNGAKAVGVP